MKRYDIIMFATYPSKAVSTARVYTAWVHRLTDIWKSYFDIIIWTCVL